MTLRLLIDGELVSGARTLDVVDPALGHPFESCACADEAQLDRAIAAAKRAFRGWSQTPQAERGAYLLRLADAVAERLEEFALLLTREQGKPLGQARNEINVGIASLRYFAALTIAPVTLRETETDLIIEHRTPLGVVAAITPWNFPFSLLMVKLAPALSAGNTVVAKPAPTTPLTTLLFGELAADILPAGVFNTIADMNDLGARLASHPDIAKIAFTGSTATGKRVVLSAAGTLKRVTLELGGNDAALILDDADVAEATQRIFQAATVNCGQVCIAAKRVYAPRALYDAVCDHLSALCRAAVVGNGLDPATQIGPLQNHEQYTKIRATIDMARRDGTLLVGGEALYEPGFFISPAVVRDIAEDACLVREEQFGPIIPVLVYDDLDDAIDRINDSEYGLAGSVWTRNYERGLEVAMRIDSGTVWVNKHYDLPVDIPFGGAKQSGLGREKGLDGLREVTQGKIVNANKLPLRC